MVHNNQRVGQRATQCHKAAPDSMVIMHVTKQCDDHKGDQEPKAQDDQVQEKSGSSLGLMGVQAEDIDD